MNLKKLRKNPDKFKWIYQNRSGWLVIVPSINTDGTVTRKCLGWFKTEARAGAAVDMHLINNHEPTVNYHADRDTLVKIINYSDDQISRYKESKKELRSKKSKEKEKHRYYVRYRIRDDKLAKMSEDEKIRLLLISAKYGLSKISARLILSVVY